MPRVPGIRTSSGVITSGGVKVATGKPNRLNPAEAAARAAHRHLWIMVAVFQVSDAAITAGRAGGRTDLDVENLLDVDGPGCFICEEPWSPGVAALPCKGEPA